MLLIKFIEAILYFEKTKLLITYIKSFYNWVSLLQITTHSMLT